VRALHGCPSGQSLALAQNGTHPGASGIPVSCENHSPVHAKPGRHPGFALLGRHVCVHNPSPALVPTHVDPVPPHCPCSFACEGLFEHEPEQKFPATTPCSQRRPTHSSGDSHGCPARERPTGPASLETPEHATVSHCQKLPSHVHERGGRVPSGH
jgi:hypothetical protein